MSVFEKRPQEYYMYDDAGGPFLLDISLYGNLPPKLGTRWFVIIIVSIGNLKLNPAVNLLGSFLPGGFRTVSEKSF